MYKVFKRILDIIISLIGLILLIPLAVIIKILYVIDKDYNSIFFLHERMGKNGRKFKMIKFRTMVPNAEMQLKDLCKDPKFKKEYELAFKINNDPRLTKWGKILRKTSLDELPQVINILLGQMSLIGPRPITPKELKKYQDKQNLLLSIRPGITGYWVIKGHNHTTYEERINLELYYVQNYSFLLDWQIFFQTIYCVISRKGQYE